jgi:phosphoribosylglycinamide formyltransferase 2
MAAIARCTAGAGLWGVEFLLTKRSVYFSELSPRPHDTGMVTLADINALREKAMQVASKVTVEQMD